MRRLAGVLVVVGAVTAGAAPTARAVTFTVAGVSDTVGSCVGTVCGSLRDAISAANALGGPDQIVLGPGVYRIERGSATPEDANATGDLDVTSDLTITGDGAAETTILGDLPKEQGDRDIQLVGLASLTLTDLTVSGGRGGENEPYNFGGGIDSEQSGTLTLERIVMKSNSSRGHASWGDGGAIAKLAGKLVVRDSALVSNAASGSGFGGALYLAGPSTSAELTNVTITANEATGEGGGIYDGAEGLVKLAFVTVSGNSAGMQGGGIRDAAQPRIRDSIVAGNRAEPEADCYQQPASEGGNVLGPTCGVGVPGDALVFDAGLAPLAGSPIPTMEPMSGSPALDRAIGPCPPTDARGVVRPQGPACDSGAAERVVVSTPSGGGSQPPTSPSPSLTAVRETNSVWRRGNRLARLSARRVPVGTVFSFTLNTDATVRFHFVQRKAGRRVNGRCVAPTHANRRRRSCRRTAHKGTLVFAAHQGVNKLSFQGRLSATRSLHPGRYTLVISASNAAGRAKARPLAFTIAR